MPNQKEEMNMEDMLELTFSDLPLPEEYSDERFVAELSSRLSKLPAQVNERKGLFKRALDWLDSLIARFPDGAVAFAASMVLLVALKFALVGAMPDMAGMSRSLTQKVTYFSSSRITEVKEVVVEATAFGVGLASKIINNF